jgi:L-ascorbate peroxidase
MAVAILETVPIEVIVSIVVAILTIVIIIQFTKGDGKKEALRKARNDIRKLIDKENCGPILVRLAWHDSGTFDVSKAGQKFSSTGGANGSIRFDPEIKHGANAGLTKAIGLLTPIKAKYPNVSWADIIQMGSAEFIEMAGGPKIPMKYGRVDAAEASECPQEGNLPGAGAPFGDGSKNAAEHLRKVFHRMGFNDQEIVALSGAHTIGRAFKERSGTTTHGYGEKGATKFTCPAFRARHDGKEGVGMAGGQSWTPKWLTFDNSYFTVTKNSNDPDLIRLETDRILETDPAFSTHYKRYAASQDAFFKDYAAVHARLSELGSIFDPSSGIIL